MQIPPWPQAHQREAELLQFVLASPQWGGFHPLVGEVEESFAAYQHCRFGLAACNGTVTLEVALNILGIGAGDEVIVPAISFVSTATAVSRTGAKPVFVDIGEDSFNLDMRSVELAITDKTKAVMAVHFGGIPCDMDALMDLCRRQGLLLIEDAAHAHGSEWNRLRMGSFGIVSSFSFQNGKVLCCGEGGMLTSSDEVLAEHARSLINCGRIVGESFYAHHRLGSNFRMTAFQAAILLAQFERLPEQIATRTRNVGLLKRLLAGVDEIRWQQQPAAMTQCSWYLLVGRFASSVVSREQFIQRLSERGVPCTPFYPHTLYQNPVYRKTANHRVELCPVAEKRVGDGFWFPHRLFLASPETIEKVAAEIKEAVAIARPLAQLR